MKEKIYINVASIPQREFGLKSVVTSLLPQCDELRVFLNGYTSIPEFLNQDNIVIYQSDINYGDTGKFYWVEDTIGYFLTVDDDIYYPAKYVTSLITKINQYDNKCVISYHGRYFLNFPLNSFYNDCCNYYHYAQNVSSDTSIHVGGTGVMGFHTDALKLKLSNFVYSNMSDVIVAITAKHQGIRIVVAEQDANWMSEIKMINDESIFEYARKNDTLQTQLINTAYQQVDKTQKI